MDVLVCATQVPFMRGGLEMMVENLVGALRDAGHRAEAVQVPAAWDRDRLLDAATAWRMVPLDADVVIPVNFPAYYARHPRKVLWLAHQHRAAYDGLGQPWSDIALDDASLEVHRQLVDWDTRALGECISRFTISGVVAERLHRYNGLGATPLYQPPPLADRLKPRPGGVGSHILCPTRLEANKRPGLFLDAMASMRKPVDGVLAGKGSLSDELQASTDRLGPVGPGQPARASCPTTTSSSCSARPPPSSTPPTTRTTASSRSRRSWPASRSSPPTTSGGVLEWVEHEVTGLVTDGSPDAMGAALDRLVADPILAKRLGAAGRERVKDLRWEQVVSTLLGGAPG